MRFKIKTEPFVPLFSLLLIENVYTSIYCSDLTLDLLCRSGCGTLKINPFATSPQETGQRELAREHSLFHSFTHSLTHPLSVTLEVTQ